MARIRLPIALAAVCSTLSFLGNGYGVDGYVVARDPGVNTSKAGLAWANGNNENMAQYEVTDKVSWYYTWSVWPVNNRRSNLEFVPMLWGQKTVAEFESNIDSVLRRGSPKVTAVLGMNEPELPAQGNMTAAEAVDLWHEHMEPLRESGLRLGSPSVSSSPAGKRWLEGFFETCNGTCNVDFIPIHWYGTDGDAFITHLWDYWYAFNRTIWVTEWACHNFVDQDRQCSPEGVVTFMNKTQSFMDNATFVERYAWFGAMKNMQGVNSANALMDGSGQISSLGRQYINSTGLESIPGAAQGLITDPAAQSILCCLIILVGAAVVFAA
ncbi:hypothetical protein FA15DRAFT_621881 [Coprinopsis marcescibilis]|uniref:Asl1-like glycosyl hydrolase catalytic domain-containing protein n=1 Tax=Coprinopsis marcescibilis TaxID=230819 RepID=A0A5C3KQM8_COPMA|nr:hypothetical protein FA15DRAFT_621881 [Coprinopsis marcescibilis]